MKATPQGFRAHARARRRPYFIRRVRWTLNRTASQGQAGQGPWAVTFRDGHDHKVIAWAESFTAAVAAVGDHSASRAGEPTC